MGLLTRRLLLAPSWQGASKGAHGPPHQLGKPGIARPHDRHTLWQQAARSLSRLGHSGLHY